MRAALLALVLCVLLFAGTANTATTSNPAPELDAIASSIAGQQVTVRCWVDDQDPDYSADAWGYVYLWHTVIYLDPRVCAGALAVLHHEMRPLWQQALGALVLTHEAYHLKQALPYWRRQSEAQTECRAVKRVPQTLTDLGATPALADAILPWALAEHYKIAGLHMPDEAPPYDWPGCAVPMFKDFWS